MVEIEERCARLLRSLRKKKGLTLRECEIQSEGRFKAVVMGSYERGTRAVSLQRLQEIADFYHVPIEYFFQRSEPGVAAPLLRYTFDLRRLRSTSSEDRALDRVGIFLSHFVKKRNDWNGEVLTIRSTDGEFLPILTEEDDILAKLNLYRITIQQKI
jgi:transcriptional regulator with XRE-family HTH domain